LAGSKILIKKAKEMKKPKYNYGYTDRPRKKFKYRGVFRGKFAEKWPISREFSGQISLEAIGFALI